MADFCGTAHLRKVDFALSKLCSAYASQRISEKLYRRQRAALIQFASSKLEEFPNLVLNEYSQEADNTIEPEVTPVIDDLGFTEDSIWQDMPTVMMPLSYDNSYYPDESHEEREPTFDRFYWIYLGVFLSALVIFMVTR